MSRETSYAVQCWHCLAEFDAVDSVWCSCSASHPTKLCPFCLACFCSASSAYKEAFWGDAPDSIRSERRTLSSKRMRLGDLLVASNRITTDQLVAALRRQSASGARLGACLVEMGCLGKEELAGFLAHQHAPVSLELRHRRIDPGLAHKVGVAACVRHRMLPVEMDILNGRRMILLAMADASNVAGIDLVQSTLAGQVLPAVAGEAEILSSLAGFYPDQVQDDAAGSRPGRRPGMLLLERAIRYRASRLELELGPGGGRVCQRIDGVLYRLQESGSRLEMRHVEDILAWSSEAVAEGVKNPTLTVDGQAWEMRLKLARRGGITSLSVRIHHPEEPLRTLASTAFTAAEWESLLRALAGSSGLVVLAGPPHSGTEHTFWGLVNAARRLGRSVLTHEAAQSHPDSGVQDAAAAYGGPLDATRVLAALSRDAGQPLFVFRARRREVVAAALGQAQRRLVALRLRARDAAAALALLRRLGADVTQLAATLVLAVSQRGVRRICDRCFAPAGLSPPMLQRFGLTAAESQEISPLRGTGCEACCPSPGYRGRETLLELHPATAHLRRQLAAGGSLLHSGRRDTGLRTLRQSCLDLLARGLTTIEEFQKLNLAPEPGGMEAPEVHFRRAAL